MRNLNELINNKESSWPDVLQWADSAVNKVEILTAYSAKARTALYNTQVTTRSTMGAIVYHSGGILVDHGWIRILGSGSDKLDRSLPEWNLGKTFTVNGEQPGMLLIADDAVGGFFVLNGGALGNDPGKVYYLAPDNLNFEALGISYTEFVLFCFSGDLNTFYRTLRWNGWENDVKTLSDDQVFTFYPYLWTEEGKDVNKVSRKKISVEEQYRLKLELIR